MICYLDTSAVIRWLLGAPNYFSDFLKWRIAGSSEVLIIETNRVLDRLRLEGKINDDASAAAREMFLRFIKGIHIIECNDIVKKRAGETFPTIIGTLDALHLSSAMLWNEQERFDSFYIISHDLQLTTAARATGIMTIGI